MFNNTSFSPKRGKI